jgi:hypothetical protein
VVEGERRQAVRQGELFPRGHYDDNNNNNVLTAACAVRCVVSQVPSIWVDRAGAKVTVTEQYTRQSKMTAGLVVEEVTTRDEQGDPCPCGMRSASHPTMQGDADGPPTTFSETGTDRVCFVQVGLASRF